MMIRKYLLISASLALLPIPAVGQVASGSLRDAIAGTQISRAPLDDADVLIDNADLEPVDDGSKVTVAEEPAPRLIGDEFYCGERRLGRWFYCEQPKTTKPAAIVPPRPSLSASERVKAINKKLDELRDAAILNPTSENVTAYIEYQNAQSERASKLADVWERVLISRPDLDYTQERPVSTLAKQDWSDNRESIKAQTMLDLSNRYGIFYFYSGNCSACTTQGNILLSLRDNYNLAIMAISEDGAPSQAFPDAEVNRGQRERMGLPGKITPTIALYDTVERRTILIGSGVISADEIVNRIYLLTQTQPGEDY